MYLYPPVRWLETLVRHDFPLPDQPLVVWTRRRRWWQRPPSVGAAWHVKETCFLAPVRKHRRQLTLGHREAAAELGAGTAYWCYHCTMPNDHWAPLPGSAVLDPVEAAALFWLRSYDGWASSVRSPAHTPTVRRIEAGRELLAELDQLRDLKDLTGHPHVQATVVACRADLVERIGQLTCDPQVVAQRDRYDRDGEDLWHRYADVPDPDGEDPAATLRELFGGVAPTGDTQVWLHLGRVRAGWLLAWAETVEVDDQQRLFLRIPLFRMLAAGHDEPFVAGAVLLGVDDGYTVAEIGAALDVAGADSGHVLALADALRAAAS